MRTFAIAELKWSHLSGHALRHPPSLWRPSVSLYPVATLGEGGCHLHAPYPPTQDALPPDPFSGCSCVRIFARVSMRAHAIAGLSHDWIHNSPPFSAALPGLLAPLAPMDTVLNYLIDDSSPVRSLPPLLLLRPPPFPPPLSPSWQLIPSVGGP